MFLCQCSARSRVSRRPWNRSWVSEIHCLPSYLIRKKDFDFPNWLALRSNGGVQWKVRAASLLAYNSPFLCANMKENRSSVFYIFSFAQRPEIDPSSIKYRNSQLSANLYMIGVAKSTIQKLTSVTFRRPWWEPAAASIVERLQMSHLSQTPSPRRQLMIWGDKRYRSAPKLCPLWPVF